MVRRVVVAAAVVAPVVIVVVAAAVEDPCADADQRVREVVGEPPEWQQQQQVPQALQLDEGPPHVVEDQQLAVEDRLV